MNLHVMIIVGFCDHFNLLVEAILHIGVYDSIINTACLVQGIHF